MDRKIRVGAVSYLNTKPLIYGFEQGMMNDEIELVIDHPAKIADELLAGTIDLGLVPVAILPAMSEYHIIGNYGITSDGPVASVCLFSEVPIDAIEKVLLDYQSRTSVRLVEILLNEYWNKNIPLEAAEFDFIKKIKGSTAAVVIGDRAFEQRKISPYIYDLGDAWKKMTGLPFVYAAWVSRKPMPDNFIKRFDAANAFGLQNIEKIIAANPYSNYNLKAYYSKNIIYQLSNERMKGLQLFLQKISK